MEAPNFSPASIRRYFATRLPTLMPPKLTPEEKKLLNPFPALALINRKTWLFIACAFCGWTWDAFDFFSVGMVAPEIAETLNRSVTDITWGITLVLMLRSVGAVVFGVASDKYGRKWPFIVNLICFIALELGSGFVQTYKQFLGVRAIYGIAMGGLYGNAAATALEDCPPQARGIISGLLQSGYALGYLLVVVFTRAIADTSPYGWRALFWFGSGPPVLIIIFRFFLPETETYLASKASSEEAGIEKQFWNGVKMTFKNYWLMFIYLVVLMAGFNFMSHGSQDLYPTMLKNQRHFSADRSTVTNCVANFGAIAGGLLIGHFSTALGRRLSIMISCVIGGALIYPWAFVGNSAGTNAGVFFLQFFVQGAWGVVPIHLSELSPPELRSSMVGIAYQMGNLASSASSTIESKIGERFPLKNTHGEFEKGFYDYGKVMAIFMGCVFGFVLIVTFFGPENRGATMLTEDAQMMIDAEHRLDAEEKGDFENLERVDSEGKHVDNFVEEVSEPDGVYTGSHPPNYDTSYESK
ncbi:Carboxylic acid transporter protein-like protein [Yarrowia sp. C11]|nr:Carboxylic acid transporter protein-like protein [Yarrowia sp. C11]KAG5371168.1 Carboxylic acid transporter protein-like protein [Yarrowia sp. E02]